MTNSRPLLLDTSVLVAYERELTRRAQAFVVQAITDGRILVTSALSLALAAAELAGQHRELRWLVDDSKEPLRVLSLSSMNALDVGTLAAQTRTVDAVSLELAQLCMRRSLSALRTRLRPCSRCVPRGVQRISRSHGGPR